MSKELIHQTFMSPNAWNQFQMSPQQKTNLISEDYLRKTDWYIIRETETGVECPPEIKTLRQQARQNIIR